MRSDESQSESVWLYHVDDNAEACMWDMDGLAHNAAAMKGSNE